MAREMGLPKSSPASILRIQAGEYNRGEDLPGEALLVHNLQIGQSPPGQLREDNGFGYFYTDPPYWTK